MQLPEVQYQLLWFKQEISDRFNISLRLFDEYIMSCVSYQHKLVITEQIEIFCSITPLLVAQIREETGW